MLVIPGAPSEAAPIVERAIAMPGRMGNAVTSV